MVSTLASAVVGGMLLMAGVARAETDLPAGKMLFAAGQASPGEEAG